MLLRTSVNQTLAIPTLWHLWVIAITALCEFAFRRSFSVFLHPGKQNTTTLLLPAGIWSLIWALPYQPILFRHKNTSCCPWGLPLSFSLTYPGSYALSKPASSWLPLCRWQVVSQEQKLGHSCSCRSSICHVHSCPPQPEETKAKHADNEAAFSEQRNQPGR